MAFLKQCFLIMSRGFKKNPSIYLLIILSQIVSILATFFAFGLIANAYTNFENADLSDRTFFINLTDRYNEEDISYEERFCVGAISFKEFDEKMDEILEILGNNIEEIAIYGDYIFDDEKYGYSSWFHGAEQEYDTYEVSIRIDPYEQGDSIIFGNQKYYIERLSEARRIVFLNYKGTPDDATVYEFWFTTKEILTYSEFEKVKDKIDEVFDYFSIEEPEAPKLLDIQMNNTQLSLSAVLIVVVVLDCALCYLFLYENRKKVFAIHRICGAEKSFCILTCLVEVLVYMIISFSLAYGVFKTYLEEIILKYYPKASIAYTFENYKWIFSGYFIATIIIMGLCIIVFFSKPIVEERK